jgi:hypothetical protein
VIGHNEVNSGAVKRARYSLRGCGFGTRSSTADSGDAGIAVGAPSCLRPAYVDFRFALRFAIAYLSCRAQMRSAASDGAAHGAAPRTIHAMRSILFFMSFS